MLESCRCEPVITTELLTGSPQTLHSHRTNAAREVLAIDSAPVVVPSSDSLSVQCMYLVSDTRLYKYYLLLGGTVLLSYCIYIP